MESYKDILIGTWEENGDDMSGLNTMIFHSGIEFNKDGSGIIFGGPPSNEDSERYSKLPFNWKFIKPNKLMVTDEDHKEGEWTTLQIEISDHTNPAGIKYFKLIEVCEKPSWDIFEPLYKIKTNYNTSVISKAFRKLFGSK